jgi:hypothetical protein
LAVYMSTCVSRSWRYLGKGKNASI